MLTVITGGSKCGKSSIAEDILSGIPGRKIYIATMEPYGDEAHAAIERHKEMRFGKGFETVEKYTDIHELDIPDGCGVLLECACNLMANEMFSAGEKEPVEKIMMGVRRLAEKSSELIIVTNSVGEDGISYPPETMEYIRNMGRLSCALSERADRVIEAVYGIPVMLKGSL
ncbi:MAG: bifunctional adenosylcobinamide kinase/adenosylcobinamide-phosphate guanylyltransferase [Oscillospiraceae bacterium]|nr:bifunctional adenosylcobinamide kinase/adenosylcobinamide-phosphate guanylyltransferase [Oscillospiraceae bacterium]